MDELELETTIIIQKLIAEFLDKPVIVGGLAMEYYQRFRNQEYQSYLDHHIDRYTSSENGIFFGISYDDKI